ncbi:MAG: hypothetical protein AAGU74_12885 [Bacillota bacterium]
MQQEIPQSRYTRFYVWMVKAKTTMGLLFTAFVFIYLLFGFVREGSTATLDLITALEMVFACFFIGLGQQIVLPSEKLTRMRCALWILIGMVVTLAFSLVFNWFALFPPWCVFLYTVFIAFGMLAMIVNNHLELGRETRRLNRLLEQFQKRNSPDKSTESETGETNI